MLAISAAALERCEDSGRGGGFLERARHARAELMNTRSPPHLIDPSVRTRRIACHRHRTKAPEAVQGTTSRAIGRWLKLHGNPANEPVAVREFRIAKKQPRPMPPDP